MKLYGLQKMTLLDFPGRVACTVFLGGCDFRCPWCHNYELAVGSAEPVMEEEEFFAFLKKREGLLEGVAVTGGEPCLSRELPAFLRKIREMGFLTKLDTNGAHPELLEQILREGLADYVAMDIKNSPERYAQTCGLEKVNMEKINESISLLMHEAPDYEFRTTVVAQLHDRDSFLAIGPWLKGAKRYFLQAFVDRDTVPFAGFTAPSKESLEEYAEVLRPFISEVSIRGV